MKRALSGFVDFNLINKGACRLTVSMAGHGCLTRMHVVRLLAPALDGEDHTKDIDFSAAGIKNRWEAGLEATRAVNARAPWTPDPVDPLGRGVRAARGGRGRGL